MVDVCVCTCRHARFSSLQILFPVHLCCISFFSRQVKTPCQQSLLFFIPSFNDLSENRVQYQLGYYKQTLFVREIKRRQILEIAQIFQIFNKLVLSFKFISRAIGSLTAPDWLFANRTMKNEGRARETQYCLCENAALAALFAPGERQEQRRHDTKPDSILLNQQQ